MSILLQQEWPSGEETYASVAFFTGDPFGWPLIAIIAVCVVVGGTFWYRVRNRKKKK